MNNDERNCHKSPSTSYSFLAALTFNLFQEASRSAPESIPNLFVGLVNHLGDGGAIMGMCMVLFITFPQRISEF